MILIYPHLHSRRTGVTSSLEALLRSIKTKYPVIIFGQALGEDFEKTSFFILLKLLWRNRQTSKVIWHANRNNELLLGIILRVIFQGLKLVAVRHSDGVPSYFTRVLFRKADAVVTLTKKVHDAFPLKSICIHHGINLEYYKTGKVLDETSEDKTKYIGVVGRVRPEKGQYDVVRASLDVLKNYPYCNIVIQGKVTKRNYKYKENIIELAKQNNIDSQIKFIDEVSDPRSIYSSLDIIVVASYTEGFSMVPLEAMAMNIPVIVTKNVGVHSELVVNNITGWLYEAGNIEELKSLIGDVCSDEEMRLKIAKSAKKEIENNWTIESEAKKYIDLYSRLFT